MIEDPKTTCKQTKELCEKSAKLRDEATIVKAKSGAVVEQTRQAIMGLRLRRNKRTVIMN